MALNPNTGFGGTGTTSPNPTSPGGISNPTTTGPAATSTAAPPTSTGGVTQAASAAAGGLEATGAGFLTTASNALQPYLTRLQQIFGGDRAKTLEAAAPEVATVSGQYDTAFRTAQTSLSRGGGRNAVDASIPFQKAGAIETTLQNEQQSAGKELGQVGTQLATLGVDASVAGSQSFASLLSTLLQNQQASDSSLWSSLGSIGELVGGAALLATGVGGPAGAALIAGGAKGLK